MKCFVIMIYRRRAKKQIRVDCCYPRIVCIDTFHKTAQKTLFDQCRRKRREEEEAEARRLRAAAQAHLKAMGMLDQIPSAPTPISERERW